MKQKNMEIKKSIDSEVYTYCSIEDALSECHRITNKETGVSIKADGELKLSYTRMRKRFDFFNNNGQDFYDSIETLWKSCTSSKSTFEDRLKKLKQVGLVTSVGKKGSVQKHTVAAMNPDDFLLERNDPILGWVNCLEYPVFGSTRQQEPPKKVEEQETEAFTETFLQEPQQPETNPVLPSSDDIHTSADSLSDDGPKPTGKVNLIFQPYNPEEEESYEEEEELEYWEIVDESPPLEKRFPSIRQEILNQIQGKEQSRKGGYHQS